MHFRQLAFYLQRGVAAGALAQAGDLILIHIQCHIQAAARRLPWESKCFERAIATKIMLSRRNMNAKLYLGVKKEGDGLVAHAWLGHEEPEDYVELACF